MSVRRMRCGKCGADLDSAGGGYCTSCDAQSGPTKRIGWPVKIPVTPPESNYVLQMVSIGIRPDDIYEARMLLAPEVDMSSIKITVKGNNLRATVRRPLSGELANQLPGIVEESPLGDLVKRSVKHRENFLIPDAIDGDKVRAVVDNKHRMLVLTAPTMKPSKAARKSAAGISTMLDA